MIGEQTARLLNAVKDAIGDRFRFVRGDIKPDVEQIFAGAGCENNAAHGSRFAVVRRARASFFNPAKSISPASPLSMPSFQAWRAQRSELGVDGFLRRHGAAQGSTMGRPQSENPPTSRVATVAPAASTMAAIRPSKPSIGLPTRRRASMISV